MGLGTKATNLITMKNLGFNVPDFEVIPAKRFTQSIDMEVIESIYTQIDFTSDHDIKQAATLIQNYLFEALPEITSTKQFSKYSVRSSTNLEDSSEYSFAGQFSTYLNVESGKLNKYIRKCIATMYNSSSLLYMFKNKININELKMNVIVQEMIEADNSGIVFSSNPQGLLNELVIVAGQGTGDNVVEEKVDVTTYFYNKTDKTMYNVTQGKSVELSMEMIESILEVTQKLEIHFGLYIDIEFCIKNDQLYILQVREITSIKDSNIVVYDNSNIVESYPGVCSPFTIQFAQDAYTKVFTSLIADFLDMPTDQISMLTSKMVDSNNGRMYYVISNWYQLLLLLPFNKKIIPLWQEMLGVKNKSYPEGSYKLSRMQKLSRNIKFFKLLLSSNKLMTKLNNDFDEINNYFKQSFSTNLSNDELFKIYDNLDNLLSSWYVTLINDMYAFLYTGMLKWYLKRIKVDNYELVCNELIRNNNTLSSMLPLVELQALVKYITSNKLLAQLENLNYETTSSYLEPNDTELKQKINNYIDVYGDRYLAELKLENETFRSNNYLLIKTLIDYCQHPFNLNECNQEYNLKTNYVPKVIIKFLQKRAQIGIAHRETSRLNRSRIFGMVRTLTTTIANNLVEIGELDNPDDVFYLTPTELRNNVIDKAVIEQRKQKNNMYSLLPHYSRLEFSHAAFNKQHMNINGVSFEFKQTNLCGIPSSGGIVQGEVAVITSLDNLRDIPRGKILVTKMTDPGWVFLLTSSVAVISEKGSLLSHTAIISRELKIPAIVGVENITRILNTGDIIEMDGSTGTIKIISQRR